MIKGVFFDLGGTLFSYRHPAEMLKLTVDGICEKLKLEHDAEEITRQFVLANKQIEHEFAEKAFFLAREYFAAVFANFLARMELQHLDEHQEWYRQFQHTALLEALTLKSDCHDTLTRLKDMGLYLSIVSNIDDDMLDPLIERAEFHRWLDHWTSSEAAQSCKPDQRFFDIVLDKSGLRPEEILFVGDSMEQDILGAHIAGMKTVLIAEDDTPAPMQVGKKVPDPDFRISRLSELPGIVESFGR